MGNYIFSAMVLLGLGSASSAFAAGNLYECASGELRVFGHNDGTLRSKISGDLANALIDKDLHPSGPTTDTTDPELGFAFFKATRFESGDIAWTVFSDYEPHARRRNRYFYYFKPTTDSRRANLEIWKIVDGARELNDGAKLGQDQLEKTLSFADCIKN